MRKGCIIATQSLLNTLPFVICVMLFSHGANSSFWVIVFSPFIVAVNYFTTKEKKDLCIWNVLLLFSVTSGVSANGLLYFNHIYYDAEGLVILLYLTALAAIVVILSSTIAVVIRAFRKKATNFQNIKE